MHRISLLKTVCSLCLMAMSWLPMVAQDTSIIGDVNNDGVASIKDVTALINYLLSSDGTSVNRWAADINMDGSITISDVSALVNCLLTGEWPVAYEPEYKTITVGSGTSAVTFRMLLVEGGTFTMGAREGDPYVRPWESPAHQVTLSDYYIAEFEVTQALWRAVMGTSSYNNPSWFTSENGYETNYQRPAESMIYSQVTSFITKLNQKTNGVGATCISVVMMSMRWHGSRTIPTVPSILLVPRLPTSWACMTWVAMLRNGALTGLALILSLLKSIPQVSRPVAPTPASCVAAAGISPTGCAVPLSVMMLM